MRKDRRKNRAARMLILFHRDGLRGCRIGMRSRILVFAFFAAAMLFSMVREWSAPTGCPRLSMTGKARTRHQ
jgi:hypothetical protein